MIILIDFDDVIFNTKKLKEDLKKVFFGCGVGKKEFEDSYLDYPVFSKDGKLRTYDPLEQIERIDFPKPENKEELKAAILSFEKNTKKYLFEDSAWFLSEFHNFPIHIVSYGNERFQGVKIKNTNIHEFIKNVHVVQESKAKIIEKIISGHKNKSKIIFIDDRSENIREVKKKFSNIVTILLKRPDGRYQEMKKDQWCDFEAHSLKEVGKIIKILK